MLLVWFWLTWLVVLICCFGILCSLVVWFWLLGYWLLCDWWALAVVLFWWFVCLFVVVIGTAGLIGGWLVFVLNVWICWVLFLFVGLMFCARGCCLCWFVFVWVCVYYVIVLFVFNLWIVVGLIVLLFLVWLFAIVFGWCYCYSVMWLFVYLGLDLSDVDCCLFIVGLCIMIDCVWVGCRIVLIALISLC